MTRSLPGSIALVVLFWTGAGTSAEPTLSVRAAAIEQASLDPDGARVVIGHISRKLAIPVETLRTQRTQTGLGWGDLLIAHRVARASKLTLEEIAGEARAGKTWEEIARAHNVDLATLSAEVKQSEDAIEQHSEDKAPNRETLFGAGKKTAPVGRY